jgi:hypothetical protein
MPLLKITQKDVDRTIPVEDGWHLFKVEKFSEDDSKDKKSKNFLFDCVVVSEGTNKGRYGFARFNSKALGMLISSGFLPAVLDRPISEELEFNPEELYGKEFYGEIKGRVYEGKIQKEFNMFSPASKVPF